MNVTKIYKIISAAILKYTYLGQSLHMIYLHVILLYNFKNLKYLKIKIVNDILNLIPEIP